MRALPFGFKAKDLKAFYQEGGALDRRSRNRACTKMPLLKLLAAHEELNAFDLLVMASMGAVPALTWALDNSAAPVDAPVAERGGQTPLIGAVKNKKDKIVSLLLERGAATQLTDDDGKTALDHAAESRLEPIARMLCEAGAAATTDAAARQLERWGIAAAPAGAVTHDDRTHAAAVAGRWIAREVLYDGGSSYPSSGELVLLEDGTLTGKASENDLFGTWSIDGLTVTLTLGHSKPVAAELSANLKTLLVPEYDEEEDRPCRARYSRATTPTA